MSFLTRSSLPLILCILASNILFGQGFDGFALFNKQNNNTAYLIDKDGNIAHSWSCDYACNYAVLLKPNGNIVRGAVNPNNQINGAAVGGKVQEIDPAGNVVWEFDYSSSQYVAHHDITLIGDNVLLTAWEVKSSSELQAAGFTGNAQQKYPTHFVEVAQDGTGGQIVWEWHMWDHMIQDVDNSKPNFGVVSEHPELMDINVPVPSGGPGGGGGDWFHVNGVNYNAELDQITFSSRFLSEVFIIDHSTTTAEAASHSGGNAGKGGDILYRWGNPSNFDGSGARTIAGPVHDARWIKAGRPNAGLIQFFNNTGGSGGSSVVDAIETPFDTDGYNYVFTAGVGYGPTESSWRHECLDDANGQSASDRMPNGNVFVNLSNGYMYEADENNNMIWSYNEGPAKAFRYTCDDPGIKELLNVDCNCDPDGTAFIDSCSTCVGGNTGLVDCAAVGISAEELKAVFLYPNPSTGKVQLAGLSADIRNIEIQVFNMYGKKVAQGGDSSEIDLTQLKKGIYLLNIQLNKEATISRKLFLNN